MVNIWLTNTHDVNQKQKMIIKARPKNGYIPYVLKHFKELKKVNLDVRDAEVASSNLVASTKPLNPYVFKGLAVFLLPFFNLKKC